MIDQVGGNLHCLRRVLQDGQAPRALHEKAIR